MTEKINLIKLAILDIDGVLTDGTKLYDSNGKVSHKRFNDKDFTAIKRLKASGVSVCFLTGDLNVNQDIANKRGIDFYYSRNSEGSLSKKDFLSILFEKYCADKNNTVYVGDDLFDLDIINELYWTFCPKDAIVDIKAACHTILNKKGGEGVISELYNQLRLYALIVDAPYEDVVKIDKIESIKALSK